MNEPHSKIVWCPQLFTNTSLPRWIQLKGEYMKVPTNTQEYELIVGSCNSPELKLLDEYFALPVNQRDKLFANTARAAELVGLSQRTIQLWIDMGLVKAFFLGRKYMVSLLSLKSHIRNQHTKSSG